MRTIYKKICIMCPTFGRAKTKLPEFINSIIATISDTKNVCVCFVVNERDKESEEVIERLCNTELEYEILYENSTECNLSQYFNIAYDNTCFKRPGTCVSMFGDDMVFGTKGWDKLVLEKINDTFGYSIVYGDDDFCQHENLCVYFVTSRELVEATGKPFMCEGFKIDCIDNVWMELGRKLNILSYMPNWHVRHDHATKVGKDSTWMRMQAGYKSSHENMIIVDEYTTEAANNVIKCLNEKYVVDDISFLMTTYNRPNILRQTVASWNKSLVLPERLFVFDDASENLTAVEKHVSAMKNAYLVKSEKHYGCNANNARAVQMFDTPAVMVIDSDTSFSPQWLIAAYYVWNQIKSDERYSGATLFNAKEHVAQDGAWNKFTIGGFGAIYKTDMIKASFKDDDVECMVPQWSWDMHICDFVKAEGKSFRYTEKSYLQHIGHSEGTHVSDRDTSDFAVDFVSRVEDFRETQPVVIKSSGTVLFSAMARLGDVVAASMIANMIIAKGFKLTWITIKKYEDFVRRICPDAQVIGIEPMIGGPLGEWSETSTDKMKHDFPRYDCHINAQLGSRENHNLYTTSGKHPCVWMRDLCNMSLGVDLGNDFRKHLVFNDRSFSIPERDLKITDNMVIIAREAKTSPALTVESARVIFNDYKERGFSPKYLLEKRPNDHVSFRELNENYIFGLTIEQCIYLIRRVEVFVGQDSGLSWCSLYSDCRKQIYHNKARVEMVNTYFGMIDDKAEDVVV